MRNFLTTLLAVVAVFTFTGCNAPKTVMWSDIHKVEAGAEASFDIVMRKTFEANNDIVPEFSSKNPPSWAVGDGLLEFVPAGSKPFVQLPLAYSRDWTYRVPAAVVGRSWDSLPNTAVIIEILGAPSDVPYIGVMKNGLMKEKPTPLPP